MSDCTTMELIKKFRKKARECRSRNIRIAYTSVDRHDAVAFTQECWIAGLSAHDAAEILNVHYATLEGWLEKATRPGDRDYLYFNILNAVVGGDEH